MILHHDDIRGILKVGRLIRHEEALNPLRLGL